MESLGGCGDPYLQLQVVVVRHLRRDFPFGAVPAQLGSCGFVHPPDQGLDSGADSFALGDVVGTQFGALAVFLLHLEKFPVPPVQLVERVVEA